MKSMIDFLLPYATGRKQWEWKQINSDKATRINDALVRAAEKYNDTTYHEYLSDINCVEIINK